MFNLSRKPAGTARTSAALQASVAGDMSGLEGQAAAPRTLEVTHRKADTPEEKLRNWLDRRVNEFQTVDSVVQVLDRLPHRLAGDLNEVNELERLLTIAPDLAVCSKFLSRRNLEEPDSTVADLVLEKLRAGDLGWCDYQVPNFAAIPKSVKTRINQNPEERARLDNANRRVLSPTIDDLFAEADPGRRGALMKLWLRNRFQFAEALPESLLQGLNKKIQATEWLVKFRESDIADFIFPEDERALSLLESPNTLDLLKVLSQLMTYDSSTVVLKIISAAREAESALSLETMDELGARSSRELNLPAALTPSPLEALALMSGPVAAFAREAVLYINGLQFNAILLNDLRIYLGLSDKCASDLFETIQSSDGEPWDILDNDAVKKLARVTVLSRGREDRGTLCELLLGEANPEAALAVLDSPTDYASRPQEEGDAESAARFKISATNNEKGCRASLTRLLQSHTNLSADEIVSSRNILLKHIAQGQIEYREIVHAILSGGTVHDLNTLAQSRKPLSEQQVDDECEGTANAATLSNSVITYDQSVASAFDDLPSHVAEKISSLIRGFQVAVVQHSKNLKGVTGSRNVLYEARAHDGPGYRAYFKPGAHGEMIVLCVGIKDTQKLDIALADRKADEEHIGLQKILLA